MKRVLVLGFAILAFGGAFLLKGRDAGPESAVRFDATSVRSDEASVGGQRLPKLLDLGSDKCIPCKRMAPILESLTEEYRGVFDVEFIDVWKDTEAGQEWKVRVIPTQIFFDASGEERHRHEGFLDKESILATWAELGVELKPAATGASRSS